MLTHLSLFTGTGKTLAGRAEVERYTNADGREFL